MTDRLQPLYDALGWLIGLNFSMATDDEFRTHFRKDANHLTAGLLSQGWARRRNHDEIVATEHGQRVFDAHNAGLGTTAPELPEPDYERLGR